MPLNVVGADFCTDEDGAGWPVAPNVAVLSHAPFGRRRICPTRITSWGEKTATVRSADGIPLMAITVNKIGPHRGRLVCCLHRLLDVIGRSVMSTGEGGPLSHEFILLVFFEWGRATTNVGAERHLCLRAGHLFRQLAARFQQPQLGSAGIVPTDGGLNRIRRAASVLAAFLVVLWTTFQPLRIYDGRAVAATGALTGPVVGPKGVNDSGPS